MIEMNLSNEARRIRRIALGDLLYRTTRKFGERTALVDGDQRINYADLDARSSRFAHYLLSTLGTGKQVAMLQNFDSVIVVDAATVTIKLTTADPAFEYYLSQAAGLMGSPKAITGTDIAAVPVCRGGGDVSKDLRTRPDVRPLVRDGPAHRPRCGFLPLQADPGVGP